MSDRRDTSERARASEGEGANKQTKKGKVENIGNSYFPALAGPLFAPEGYSRREYLARVRKYEETLSVIDEHY